MTPTCHMYLIDTNVISEARKGARANLGVTVFFAEARERNTPMFLSVITLGELRRGVELIRHRGDRQQAHALASWLDRIIAQFADRILDIDTDIAQLWGALRTPHPQHALDKLIAATAMIHNLTVVTRNEKDFAIPQLKVINPFSQDRVQECEP